MFTLQELKKEIGKIENEFKDIKLKKVFTVEDYELYVNREINNMDIFTYNENIKDFLNFQFSIYLENYNTVDKIPIQTDFTFSRQIFNELNNIISDFSDISAEIEDAEGYGGIFCHNIWAENINKIRTKQDFIYYRNRCIKFAEFMKIFLQIKEV